MKGVWLAVLVSTAAGAQERDAGDVDGGDPHAGEIDAGEIDAGEIDAGEIDAGSVQPAAVVPSSPPHPDPLPRGEREGGLTTVVTGGRLAQQLKDTTVAVEVISKRQLQESGARDLSEALEARPGLETSRNVGQSGLRMGGLGPQYNLIMIDGQRMAGRINGGVDLSRLTVENIEQIEIVKGPSSVLWGSDALAGTINIITRAPSKPLGGNATVSYGLRNQMNAAGAGEAAGDKWGVMLTAGYERRDAYDWDRATPATSGSSIDQGQGSLRARFGGRSKDDPSVDVRIDATRRVQHGIDENGVGGVFDRATRDNILEGRINGRLPVGNGELSLSASASSFDRLFVNDQRDSTVLDDVQIIRDNVAQLDGLASQTFFSTHTALVGGQVLFETTQTPRLVTGRSERFRGALFVQDTWAPAASRLFSLAAGVRGDFDSLFGLTATPRVALRFDPLPTLALRLSTGLGYRAPSFQELYISFENPSAGYVIDGRPDLQPERSFGTNLSAQWSPGRWLFSLSLFWNELWMMIGVEPTSMPGELLRYRYVNIGKARTRGVEASVSVMILEGLSAEAGYTFTDARDISAGLPLEGQAQHRGFGQVRWRQKRWGLTASARISVTGPRPLLVDDTTVRYTAPFAMLDARVAKAFGTHLELFLAGMNLLDQGSQDLPMPPRSLYLGLTVRD
ncbi:MAG: TonB-dependent receptor [Archangiaceae bacterium]|nr:TonB-dependent receptor [Archangiaceae bacterium]